MANPTQPYFPHPDPHRSWSDNRVPVPDAPSSSAYPPRSSSFSASSSARPNFMNQPPPPVPPLPRSLLPGLTSRAPAQAHGNLDLFFTRNTPHTSSSPISPVSFLQLASPTSPQTPYGLSSPNEQKFYVQPPLVPPRPTTAYLPKNASYGNIFTHDEARHTIYQASAPPPVPPRPPTAAIDRGSEASASDRAPLNSPDAVSPQPKPPPPLPPKLFSSPTMPHFPAPSNLEITSSFPADLKFPLPALYSPYVPLPPLPPKLSTFTSSDEDEALPGVSLQDPASPVQSPLAPQFTPSPYSPSLSSTSSNLGPVPTPLSPSNSSSSSLPSLPLPEIPLPEVPLPESPLPEVPLPEIPLLEIPLPDAPKDSKDNNAAIPSPVTPTSDLQRALTLSLSDSTRQKGKNKQADIEEDELARALAESLAFSAKLKAFASYPLEGLGFFAEASSAAGNVEESQSPPYNSSSNETGSNTKPSMKDATVDSTSSTVPEKNSTLLQELADAELTRQLEIEDMTRQLQEEESERLAKQLEEQERLEDEARRDAEMVRRIQEEENRRLEEERRERERFDEEAARQQVLEDKAQKLIRDAQERKDAEMARMMADAQTIEQQEAERTRRIREEEARLLEEDRLNRERKTSEAAARKRALDEEAQRVIREAHNQKMAEKARKMAEAKARLQAQQGPSTPPLRFEPPNNGTGYGAPQPPQYTEYTEPPHAPPVAQPQRPTQPDSPTQHLSRARAASAVAVTPRRTPEAVARSSTVGTGTARHPNTNLHPAEQSWDRSPSPGEGVAGPSSSAQDPSAASDGDSATEDVMKGISYGFKPPDIRLSSPQTGAAQPCPPFPDVIALFPAPSPPFHVMAPSWRHLVRLLAQQECRVEVNLATIAGTKAEHHLRIVVQFLKLSYTANTWRTVIYLSLDEPIPATTPAAWRFTNGDTSILPYSYTKGEELRHLTTINANSQVYAIPLSTTSPFPILPITLPNIALYLQSAMRDSRARKVQNDQSSGMRRLAKIVTTCYPDEVIQEPEERKPSRSVGNLFKRVVGRGPERQESHGNEDVYDIITPFRLDQYVTP